jgi:hypothetical protein
MIIPNIWKNKNVPNHQPGNMLRIYIAEIKTSHVEPCSCIFVDLPDLYCSGFCSESSHFAVAGSSHLDFSCLLTEGCWAQNMEYDGILAIFWIVKRVRMKLFFDLKQLCGSIIPRRAPNTSRTLEALFTPYKFSGRLDSSFNKINALGKLKKKNKTVK